MRHEDRLNLDTREQFEHSLTRQAASFEFADRIADAARLWARRVVLEIGASPTDTMDLLSQIDRLKPTRKRTLEITSQRRCTIGNAPIEFCSRSGITVASSNGERSITFDELEQFDTALLAQHVAHQSTQHVHVVTQRGVLRRKLDFGTLHGGDCTPAQRRKARKEKGRAAFATRPSFNSSVNDQRNE